MANTYDIALYGIDRLVQILSQWRFEIKPSEVGGAEKYHSPFYIVGNSPNWDIKTDPNF